MKKIISLCVALGSCLLASCGFQTKSTVSSTSSTSVTPSIHLDCSQKTLFSGETFTLTASLSPDQDGVVVWTSSNEAVASVAYGVVFAKAGGNATILATYKGKSASCLIEVIKGATSLRYQYKEVLVQAGSIFDNVCSYTPADASGAIKYYTARSSDPSVCEVMSSYYSYKAKKTGYTKITMESNLNHAVKSSFDCVVVDASLKTVDTQYSHVLRSYEIDAIKTNGTLCNYNFGINGSILSTLQYSWADGDEYLTKVKMRFLLLSYYVDFGDGVLFKLGEKKFNMTATELDGGYYAYYFSFYCSLSKIKALSGRDYLAGFNFITETGVGYEWIRI